MPTGARVGPRLPTRSSLAVPRPGPRRRTPGRPSSARRAHRPQRRQTAREKVAPTACSAMRRVHACIRLLHNAVMTDNTVIVGRVPAVKSHTAELATRLVDEAGRILAAEGAGALTLRRLATVTGTSTMAVYTLFGDKNGLLSAMHREGFARLAAALDRVSVDPDPLEALA